MAFPHHLSLSNPLITLPLWTPLPKPTNRLSCSCSVGPTPEGVLEAVANSERTNSLPCVRTYENDTARLSLSGSVAFDQALAAASADGGAAAHEHLEAGLDVMVVETLFPARLDDRSTMATRLFLPARKVKEKARRLRSSLPDDILSGANSRNILAMTFRQVVVQQLFHFDLAIFKPGSQRNMMDLGSQREVTATFSLSSSDEKAICGLAEAVCILALESTERELFKGSAGETSNGFFGWFSKTKKFASKDSSVMLYRFEDEIVENAQSLFDNFNMWRAKHSKIDKKPAESAWTSSIHSKLEKIGGPEFSLWVSEHVPAYKLEIDANRITSLNFEGWKQNTRNRCEVFLTHSQMVGLANVLDMYFEDIYTLPSKQLSFDVARSPKKLSKSKEGFSLLGFLRTTLIAATLLVSVGVMVKLFVPHVYSSRRRHPGEYPVLSSSSNDYDQEQPVELEASQLEAYSSVIIGKLKEFYGWNGDVMFDSRIGAWIGEVPTYLRNDLAAESSAQDKSAFSGVLATSNEELKSSVQDIASYQVVLSSDGTIAGFQPTSRVAVNHWSANPIAKELYGGKELSPGILEPGLKINKPDKVIVLELLMSLNQDNYFALTRTMQ